MDYPILTNTQHAYYFNRDNFLKGITERAGRLFDDGYRVAPHPFDEHTFTVSKQDGTEYSVNPVANTCSCPFFTHQETAPLAKERVACKHLEGLSLLVFYMLSLLEDNQERRAYCTLAGAWDEVGVACEQVAVTPAA